MSWLPGWDGPPAPSAVEVVDRAAAMGARSITVIEVTGVAPPLEMAAAAFATLCDLARQAGILMHIEPFPWSGISDFGFAADIVAGAGRSNGGILLDTWHLFRGPDLGLAPARLDPRTIFGLQINDVRPAARDSVPYEAMHDRLLPGAGAAGADIRKLLLELRDVGCDAPMGVEVFSDELAMLPPREIAQHCQDALRQLLD
jgi:sugar phosphate isomerase/epimerase